METFKSYKKSQDEGCYYVKLPAFEGPFDLLFHLINKEEVDIWNISLSRITEQYLSHLHSLPELNTDMAGDFLVMAASLLHLKSRMLLPQAPSSLQEREEEALFFGSKEELVRRLLEYKHFKSIAEKLREREEQQKKIYLRLPGPRKYFIINRQLKLTGYDLNSLQLALMKLLEKNTAKHQEKEKIKLPEGLSFTKKISQINSRLKKYKNSLNYYLEDFLLERKKAEVVLTFFALLELAKRGILSLKQEKKSSKIQVLKKYKSITKAVKRS